MTALVQLDTFRRQIELATSFDEVKSLRDRAETVRHYLRQAKKSLLLQNRCAELRIRAERKLGAMLHDTVVHQGGRPKKQSHGVTVSGRRLSDLGITRMQSHRLRVLAGISDEVFENHLAIVIEEGKELTTRGLLLFAKNASDDAFLRTGSSIESPTDAVWQLERLVVSGQRFATIYADPPWKYGNQATRASTDKHYVTMTTEEIAALPVAELAEKNAHLHLWTTTSFLPAALEILEAWGFQYKSQLVWDKGLMGLGNYWRIAHEILLLGVRGRLPFLDHSQMSLLHVRREKKHSAKPPEMRTMIEKVSPSPYLELFGRQTAPGWTVWGNEIEETLFNREIMEAYRQDREMFMDRAV